MVPELSVRAQAVIAAGLITAVFVVLPATAELYASQTHGVDCVRHAYVCGHGSGDRA